MSVEDTIDPLARLFLLEARIRLQISAARWLMGFSAIMTVWGFWWGSPVTIICGWANLVLFFVHWWLLRRNRALHEKVHSLLEKLFSAAYAEAKRNAP